MEKGCDHLEGSPMGMCAICGKTVCSECYRTVFNETICDEHLALEEESGWELVGIFADPTVVADRRFRLEENGISSLSVQSDEDVIELYVPAEEKDEGFAVLQGSAEEGGLCHECRIQYPADHEVCPLCGGKHTEPEGRSERDE